MHPTPWFEQDLNLSGLFLPNLEPATWIRVLFEMRRLLEILTEGRIL